MQLIECISESHPCSCYLSSFVDVHTSLLSEIPNDSLMFLIDRAVPSIEFPEMRIKSSPDLNSIDAPSSNTSPCLDNFDVSVNCTLDSFVSSKNTFPVSVSTNNLPGILVSGIVLEGPRLNDTSSNFTSFMSSPHMFSSSLSSVVLKVNKQIAELI